MPFSLDMDQWSRYKRTSLGLKYLGPTNVCVLETAFPGVTRDQSSPVYLRIRLSHAGGIRKFSPTTLGGATALVCVSKVIKVHSNSGTGCDADADLRDHPVRPECLSQEQQVW